MKTLKFLIFIFITASLSAQVGVNTESPTAMLDIAGDARIRNLPTGNPSDSIVVSNNGFLKKIAVSDLFGQTGNSCPDFVRSQSNSFYLLFKSESSIPNPNNGLTIEGLNFVSAGTWVQSNNYYFSYSNTSGNPLNLSGFTVDFSGVVCEY